MFQGVAKEISGKKWVNITTKFSNSYITDNI